MSKIKIETLTAVHVGSGESLQYGTDFIPGVLKDDAVISIIEPSKVLDLIGELNVHYWAAAIERKETTSSIVKLFAPKAQLTDYTKRIIMEWSASKSSDTLKEQIHNGQGRPYIPGSSIKGAIRTAVLATLARNHPNVENKLKNKFGKTSAEQIESELFGNNPNQDIFRFLQVGDAYFGELRNVAVRMVNINERERQGFWDESKSQLIEAISPDDQSEFQMKLNLAGYNFSQEKVHGMPSCMRSVNELFGTINSHTKALLEDELDYWGSRENNDFSGKVAIYMKKIKEILSAVNQCAEGKECVLRVGHGSGWRFITGAWTEELDNFHSLVVPISRPKNFKYESYDFPKTRRVDNECELLGFVKLSVIE